MPARLKRGPTETPRLISNKGFRGRSSGNSPQLFYGPLCVRAGKTHTEAALVSTAARTGRFLPDILMFNTTMDSIYVKVKNHAVFISARRGASL